MFHIKIMLLKVKELWILVNLQKKCQLNILVVVVRYFGGTLLGTGGLMVAYREASKAALENYG